MNNRELRIVINVDANQEHGHYRITPFPHDEVVALTVEEYDRCISLLENTQLRVRNSRAKTIQTDNANIRFMVDEVTEECSKNTFTEVRERTNTEITDEK